MTKKEIAAGIINKVQKDLEKAIVSSQKTLDAWNDLTSLGRNEWICWTTSVKKPETRKEHIERVCAEITKGKRRPCCWSGCPHR